MITVILGHFYFAEILEIPFATATALVVAVILRLIWLGVEFGLALVLYPFGQPQRRPASGAVMISAYAFSHA